MIRWTPPNPTRPLTATRWQSRVEILKKHLDSLSPEELRQVRPDYYWLRFGQEAWKREQARKANFNPNQPRVPAGNPDGGQWTDAGGGRWPSADGRIDIAARISRQREAECENQYKRDSVICRIVQTPLCWEQAMKRRAACISGYQLPPLNF